MGWVISATKLNQKLELKKMMYKERVQAEIDMIITKKEPQETSK
jgi:hypothetical protein